MSEALDVLKPCPFCGGTKVVMREPPTKLARSGWRYVECERCGVATDFKTSAAKARKAWNRRDGERARSVVEGEEWISVNEKLPPSNRPVIAAFRNPLGNWRVIRAQYAAPNTLPVDDDSECAGTYDEASGTYYCEAGWYEDNEHEEVHWRVDDAVSHWQPLPTPPTSTRDTERTDDEPANR
jgi:Lar family restriction alleviation protein